MKVSIVLGTRPEAIKLAPVIHELRKHSEITLSIISTGQHREMLTPFLKFFEITPDEDLAIMKPGSSLTTILWKAISKLERYFQRTGSPALLIVQGDTTTALAAALVAYYRKVPLAHVEAGLRSFDRENPFPEELNRVLISHLATHHFAPTEKARANLLREGIDAEHIFITGNTVVDALLWAREKILSPEYHPLRESLSKKLGFPIRGHTPYLLVTAHRRENIGRGIQQICKAIQHLISEHPKIHIVWPVHLNPEVGKIVRKSLSKTPRVHLLPPVDYPQFLTLLNGCRLVLTDSGGIQEEAPTFRKPTLVMRSTTERVEALETGGALLVGTHPLHIARTVNDLLNDPERYRRMASIPNPFGDGKAARRIVSILLKEFVK